MISEKSHLTLEESLSERKYREIHLSPLEGIFNIVISKQKCILENKTRVQQIYCSKIMFKINKPEENWPTHEASQLLLSMFDVKESQRV